MKIKEWKGTDIDLSCAIQVIKYLEGVVGYDDTHSLRCVYTAVTELLSNIAHHAYPSNACVRNDVLWKITVSTQTSSLTSIVVEDYGITIPQSIIQKINLKPNQNTQRSDNELIEEAVGQTVYRSTEGRGQGLQSITKNVDDGHIKHFSICSRDGYFQYKIPPGSSNLEGATKTVGTSIEIIIPGVKK